MDDRWWIRTAWTLLVGCLWTLGVSGQAVRVTGTLRTVEGEPIPNASVRISDAQGRVVAFKASDAKGSFLIILPPAPSTDSLRLLVDHLGYARVEVPISQGRTRYDISLEEKPIDLSEVKVKSRPRMDMRGDTLSYDVGSFAKTEDRSIGDVLRRMPGMEVSENGQISYNGQSISNFYIDGDDLLDDKYSIGTKTIPHAMVQKLEVLQNHQPLKVLKNKTLSDRVAINLVIKDDARLKHSGQAKVGIGLPHQYDSELNSILFNKKYKTLNVLKGNNVGEDLAADFTAFHISDMLADAGNTRPQALLSSGTAGTPPLPRHRYYTNNSGSLNLNNLVNLRSGIQLKANIHGMLDGNNMVYNSWSELFLGDDTVRYSEWQDIDRHPFLADASLTVTANEPGHYFNNILKLDFSGDLGISSLQSNDVNMHQRLQTRVRDFSNTLEYIPELKNGNVVNFYWYVNYFNRPQQLTIEPGINEAVLNNGVPFDRLHQQGETPTWFSRASAAYGLTKGVIRQRYRLGMISEWQGLRSALLLTQAGGRETPYTGSAGNDLSWRRHRLFLDGTYEYKRGFWEATMVLPLAVQGIAYKDSAFALSKTENRWLFNPSVRVKRMTTHEDYLSLDYHYANQLGNINGVFRGAILVNYRNIQANSADLQEHDNHTMALRYNFQRAVNMLFMHAGVSYSRSTANTIASNVVSDNIASMVLLPFENRVNSVSLNGALSKFIFAFGATASLKASWSISRLNQLVNGNTLPFSNRSLKVSPAFEVRLFGKISFNYDGTGTWTTSRLVRKDASLHVPNQRIRLLDQTVNLSYSLLHNTFLRISGQHQYANQEQSSTGYFFADASLRHRFALWRMEMELKLTNLANVIAYETYSLTANQLSYSRYALRGRMALISCTFNL